MSTVDPEILVRDIHNYDHDEAYKKACDDTRQITEDYLQQVAPLPKDEEATFYFMDKSTESNLQKRSKIWNICFLKAVRKVGLRLLPREEMLLWRPERYALWGGPLMAPAPVLGQDDSWGTSYMIWAWDRSWG